MCHTHMIISLRLKHKIDKYTRYVNIVNVVLFAKTSKNNVNVGFNALLNHDSSVYVEILLSYHLLCLAFWVPDIHR